MAIVTRRVIVLPARLQIEMFEAMMLDEILSNRLFAGADALSCRSDRLRLSVAGAEATCSYRHKLQ